jgi:hypothetical protein
MGSEIRNKKQYNNMTKHEATKALADKLLEELRSKLADRMYTSNGGIDSEFYEEFSLIDDIQALISALD